MAKMRSAVLVGPRDIRIEEVDRPIAKDDTVIVRIESLGICGSNLHWWSGTPLEQGLMRFPLPGGGGHEYAGVVDEVGSRVTRVKPGDRVVVDFFESTACGACAQCGEGLYGQCEQRRFLGIGGFVDFLETTERGLYRLPESVETRIAAVVEPAACAVSGVRRAELQGGETVVVLGAGVLGLCAAAAAKALGAGKVLVTAKHAAQAELALRFGADVVLDSGDEDLTSRIRAETEGRGADRVIETVGGHAPTLSQALEVLRPACTIVVLGLWDEPVPVDSWSAVLKDARLIFSLTYGRMGLRHDFELCLEWLASGQLPLRELVTHTRPLDEIGEAFTLAADKTQGVIKVIVTPWSGRAAYAGADRSGRGSPLYLCMPPGSGRRSGLVHGRVVCMFQRSAILAYGIIAYAIGVSSLVGWILCMLGVMPLGVAASQFSSMPAALGFASLLVLVFAAQHTVMARPAFKTWWTGIIPASAERATFVLMTGLTLWPALLFWPPLPQVIWSIDDTTLAAALYAFQLAGWAYLFAASFAIDHFELFGLQQVYLQFVGREYRKVPFKERWMYRFDRHPIMTGALIGLWVTPNMTLAHLCFSALVTAYMVFGVSIEERDLVRQWGDEYLDYANRVSSVVPVIRK